MATSNTGGQRKNIVHLANDRMQEKAAAILHSMPRNVVPRPNGYCLAELSNYQHDTCHVRPCELCAFGRCNREDGSWCGAELFMNCLQILGRRAFFVRKTKRGKDAANQKLMMLITKRKPTPATSEPKRDPFDHHDPDYDEHWLENNIDNPMYEDI